MAKRTGRQGTGWRWLGRGLLAVAVLAAGVALGSRQAAAARSAPRLERWHIAMSAYPDSVGVGGLACLGCDGLHTLADDMGAAGAPLPPLHVLVHALGDRRTVYWQGLVRRDRGGAVASEQLYLSAPPPYQVELLTTRSLGYSLCPNSRAGVVLTQRDFDSAGRAGAGQGRSAKVSWYFWSCRAPGGG